MGRRKNRRLLTVPQQCEIATVELCEARLLLASDFGDAPAPYPVSLADDGARHVVGAGKLGAAIDAESDGTPSAAADADGSDDDGIDFSLLYPGKSDAKVVVTAANITPGSRVDAWIDFNADGDWTDPGEKFLNSVQVINGQVTLLFSIPGDAAVGPTFARFRLSSTGGLSPTGLAPDGEVEDYKVEIVTGPPVITMPAFGEPRLVDVTGTYRVSFEWNQATGATSYELFVSSAEKYRFLEMTVTGTSVTPNVDFPLGNYNVWMRSVSPGNIKSVWSPVRTFSTIAKSSFVPMPKLQNTARPTVAWNAVAGATSYKIWISNVSTGQGKVIYQENIQTTSFTPASDFPLGLYRAWVQAVYNATTELWSPAIDFQVAPAPIPTAGINPTFDQTPTLTWSTVAGAVSYDLQVRNQTTGITFINQNVSSSSFTPTANLADGPYRWWVRARSAQNVLSLWSPAADFSVGGRTSVLSPTGSTSDRTPTFTWKPVDGATRYELWVSRIDVPSTVINQTNIVSTSFTPAANLAVGSYRTWVRAVSGSGQFSVWSIAVNFTVT